jgi:hypothetical protein
MPHDDADADADAGTDAATARAGAWSGRPLLRALELHQASTPRRTNGQDRVGEREQAAAAGAGTGGAQGASCAVINYGLNWGW